MDSRAASEQELRELGSKWKSLEAEYRALEYHDAEEDDGDLLCNPALHRWGCGIDAVVEVEEDDIR